MVAFLSASTPPCRLAFGPWPYALLKLPSRGARHPSVLRSLDEGQPLYLETRFGGYDDAWACQKTWKNNKKWGRALGPGIKMSLSKRLTEEGGL